MTKIDKWFQHEGCVMRRLTYGVGIIDTDYVLEPSKLVNGKRVRQVCPYYSRWKNMLRRCYHKKSMWETYNKTEVCKEWLTFSNFRAWMEKQDWEGKELDKDILGGGTLYSPTTCKFVDKSVNSFVLESSATRGETMLGVHFNKREQVYEAHGQVGGRKKHLGRYKNQETAHLAWCLHKRCMLDKMDVEDREVRVALEMKYDYYVDNALREVAING